MGGYNFSLIPQQVPLVNTEYRKIITKIPVPESISILKDLEKYESRSMHGQLPIIWDKAEDYQVYDQYGNCWIDFTSTIFVTNTGHSNPHILSAIQNSINNKLIHTYTFANKNRAMFLKKLINITPDQFEKAFLLSAGTEATECAIKLMRMHGQTFSCSKLAILSFQGAMHGRTMGAEMLKGDPSQAAWIGYEDPNIYHLPFPYPWTVRKSLEKDEGYNWEEHFHQDMNILKTKGLNFKDISGFMIESYLGWGAIFYPTPYITAISNFARKHNCMITFDEIQGGFGRTGKMFAYQHYGIEPDLICLGKAISGGLPLSAVLGSKEIMDLPDMGSMSSTHSANPLCCAASHANLKSLESGNLIAESARKGKLLHNYLNSLKQKYPDRISHIFGKGLIAGVLFKEPSGGNPDGLITARVCETAMQKGLLLVHTGRESVKIGPPLSIPDEALLEGLDVFDESIQEVIK